MPLWDSLLTLTVLLAAAALLGAVFERLRQSAIVGFLLAGAIVGPGGMQWVADEAAVGFLAELGVALLLFTIGLEFSMKRLRALGMFAVTGGTIQILATAALFGGGALALGLPGKAAAVVGLLAAPSSTACVLRLLRDRAEMDSVHGRAATGILLLQDLALVPMVLIVAALSGGEKSQAEIFNQIATASGLFLALVGVFYGFSKWVFPRLARAAAALHNRELLILLASTMALSSTWLAHSFHLSPALGAFIAGLLLAGSPFATQLRADVATIRVLFVTLFFVSVGMLSNLSWIASHAGLVAAATATILVGQALVVAPLARAFGLSWAHGVAAAICLAQIGEFSFVLGQTAWRGKTISDHVFNLLVSSALTTMLLTPALVSAAPRARDWLKRKSAARGKGPGATGKARASADDAATPFDGERGSGPVVVVGLGPAGRQVVSALVERGIPVAVTDLNFGSVSAAERKWASRVTRAVVGDATQEEILDHVGVKSARALVVTIPDHHAALGVVRQARGMSPGLRILVRARYSKYASEYAVAGAEITVDEEECIGKELARELELKMENGEAGKG